MALKLLEKQDSRVVGISRSATIMHDGYTHLYIDLSDPKQVIDSAGDIFPQIIGADKIVLINNAGTLGQVGYLGNLDSSNLSQALLVNLVAPAVLTNEFIKAYKNTPVHKTIINISTGAAKQPVDGWAGYCSSKAGLDMLTQVGAKEAKFHHEDINHYAISPGIIDTEMQDEIRKVTREDFSRLDEFIEYKKENMLLSPDKVAEQVLQILDEEEKIKKPLVSVREL